LYFASSEFRAHEPAGKLKSYLFKARGLFTQLYERWSVSGQNDPEQFDDFLPRAPRSSETSTEGKRAQILFIAMQSGTPDEYVDALNFTKKNAPAGVGFDDLDSDSSGDRGNAARPTKRLRATEGDPRRDALQKFGNILATSIQPLFDGIHPARPTIPSLTTTSESDKTDILLNKFEDVAAKLQEVRSREMPGQSP
jgi:hypothetical protein